MSDPGRLDEEDMHVAARDAFVSRAGDRFDDEIEALYVFGSTVRGEAQGLSSDIDVLVVLDDRAAQESAPDALRDIAYDVMLEYGPVVELHILSKTEFVEARHRGNPFLETVVTQGRSYA